MTKILVNGVQTETNRYVYDSIERYSQAYQKCFIEILYWEQWFEDWAGRWKTGYIIDEVKYRKHQLQQHTEYLYYLGWSGEKGDYVPNTHKRKRRKKPRTHVGWMRERKVNTDVEYGKYRRQSRHEDIEYEFDYRWYDWCPNRGERCWKRTKKRKQWM